MEIIAAPETEEDNEQPQKTRRTKPAKPAFEKLGRDVIKLIATTIDDLADENGWAFLGDVGNLLLKKTPDFDPRVYGFQKLTPLIKAIPQFEIDKRETDRSGIKLVYIRNR